MTNNSDCKILELDHPHGFLIWRGKQTAVGTPESLPVGEKLLVVSEGEAFGYVMLKEPARMKAGEFDREEYHKEHRLYPTEWRLDWPDTKTLNLYRFSTWEPFEKALPFENGEIIADQPTPHEAALIEKSRLLPKTLVLDPEAVTMTGGKFTVADGVSIPDDLKQILQTTYETEVEFIGQKQTKYLPLYRLALVRVPNMRVKKNAPEPINSGAEVTSGGKVQVQQDDVAATASVKQENDMPWEKVRDHADCPSDKPVAVIKTGTGEVEGCHANEEDANMQLAALNASEEGESDKDSGEKQESLQQRLVLIQQQFIDAFTPEESEYKRDFWVVDVFDSFLITNESGRLFRVNYMMIDDSIAFSPEEAWVEVEAGYSPKGFALLARNEPPKKEKDRNWKDKLREAAKMDYLHEDMILPMHPRVISFAELMEAEHAQESSNNVHRLTDQFQMMVQNILDNPMIEDKQAPLSELIYEYGVLVNKTMTEKKQWQPLTDLTKKAIKKIFKRDKEESPEPDNPLDGVSFDKPFGIAIKTVNGEPWHLSWSTNAFRDRDGEIFTTKALENFVIESEQNGYKGFFNLWHIEGTDFAVKEWKAVVGRFLVEAGPYLDNEAGRRAKAFFQEYPDGHPDIAPEGWGASPEFRFLPEERAKDGIFHWLWITRTSTLPRAAAANIWTKGMSIMAMTKQQEQAAIAAFGKEFVERLKAEAGKETAALEQVADHKAAKESPEESEEQVTEVVETEEEEETEESAAEQMPVINVSIEELAAEVKKQFEMDLQPVAQAMAEILAEVKGLADRVTKLEKTEATKQQVETPRFRLELLRASQAEETVLAENDELKGKKPEETSVTKDGSLMSSFFTTPK